MKSKFSLFKAFLFYDSHKLKPTTMLGTGVGDRFCWWQRWEVDDRFEMMLTDTKKSPT